MWYQRPITQDFLNDHGIGSACDTLMRSTRVAYQQKSSALHSSGKGEVTEGGIFGDLLP